MKDPNRTICDFDECNQPIRKKDLAFEDPETLRFCAEHGKQCDDLIAADNISGLVVFWAKSYGDLTRLVR